MIRTSTVACEPEAMARCSSDQPAGLAAAQAASSSGMPPVLRSATGSTYADSSGRPCVHAYLSSLHRSRADVHLSTAANW
jgi:hypothetical protein